MLKPADKIANLNRNSLFNFAHVEILLSQTPHRETYFWQGEGKLSLKWFTKGHALYEADKGRFAVDQNGYLILNHEQFYSVLREPEKEVESLILFFENDFATDVFRNLVQPEHKLLDEPLADGFQMPEFFTRVYQPHQSLFLKLHNLRQLLQENAVENFQIEEFLHEIFEEMLRVHRLTKQEIKQISAIKSSTREELYRRLYRARDFILASFQQPILLAEVSRIACLSPNHFLRHFKQLFKKTPHQFLTDVRLEKAKTLLRQTSFPVTEICFQIGFESLGSFSTLFRKKVGVSPQDFRQKR